MLSPLSKFDSDQINALKFVMRNWLNFDQGRNRWRGFKHPQFLNWPSHFYNDFLLTSPTQWHNAFYTVVWVSPHYHRLQSSNFKLYDIKLQEPKNWHKHLSVLITFLIICNHYRIQRVVVVYFQHVCQVLLNSVLRVLKLHAFKSD